MSDPVTFPSSTPAIGLPYLVAGQAQKEFFVNQSLCLLDALQMRTVKDPNPHRPPQRPTGRATGSRHPRQGPGRGGRIALRCASPATGTSSSLSRGRPCSIRLPKQ